MRVHKIVSPSYVDGPGQRTALFLQGCSIHCAGCQNAHLWDAAGGENVDPQDPSTGSGQALAERLLFTGLPVTITGGEPFDQADDLACLVNLLRKGQSHIHIIIYTGYTIESLLERNKSTVAYTLCEADVLVDGPYIATQDNPFMQYRGSANQRVIDLPATFAQGRVVTLDWDTTEVIITADGGVLGTAPVVAELGDLGAITGTRRCGETR